MIIRRRFGERTGSGARNPIVVFSMQDLNPETAQSTHKGVN